MSKELLSLIRETGDKIQPELKPKPGYPTRNGIAHIFKVIKEITGKSYKDADPEMVLGIVWVIENNPNLNNLAEIKQHAQIRIASTYFARME